MSPATHNQYIPVYISYLRTVGLSCTSYPAPSV